MANFEQGGKHPIAAIVPPKTAPLALETAG